MKLSINPLVAVAAVMMSINGYGADAATVASYNVSLRYEGTAYSDLLITDYGPGGAGDPTGWQDFPFGTLVAENSGFALPTLRPGLEIGDKVAFRARLAIPDDPYTWVGPFDNKGRALRCNLAGVKCTDGVTATYPDGDILFGEYRSLLVGSKPGETLSYVFNNGYYSSETLGWGQINFFNRIASFTILSFDEPAPVPLPASAALLSLGIGAIVLMRKRRRKSD